MGVGMRSTRIVPSWLAYRRRSRAHKASSNAKILQCCLNPSSRAKMSCSVSARSNGTIVSRNALTLTIRQVQSPCRCMECVPCSLKSTSQGVLKKRTGSASTITTPLLYRGILQEDRLTCVVCVVEVEEEAYTGTVLSKGPTQRGRFQSSTSICARRVAARTCAGRIHGTPAMRSQRAAVRP